MISSAISNLPDLETDTWVKASFEDLLALAEDMKFADAKFYYNEGYLLF